MGSMTEVMRKLQEAASTDSGDPPVDGPVPAAPPATEPESTAFVADGPAASDSLHDVSNFSHFADAPVLMCDRETVKWDAKKVHPAVIVFHERSSSISEQYRTIRARLLTLNTTQANQIIVITSAVPQEGKSVSVLNLGMVMAENGEHRILIADADFRRSSIASMVGMDDVPGLAHVLSGEAELRDAIRPTPFPNLKILPAGRLKRKNYAELLGGSLLRSALEQFRGAFDYTFVDTPPITTVADVGLLAPHCDGAILVIEMRRTPEPAVQQAVRTLQTNNVKILGTVLSRFRDHRTQYYGRYYNYY